MNKSGCGKNIKELSEDKNSALRINSGDGKDIKNTEGFDKFLEKKRKKISEDEFVTRKSDNSDRKPQNRR